jgi:hypothetical protein
VLDFPSLRLLVSALTPGEPALDTQIEGDVVPGTSSQPARDMPVALLREYLDPLTGNPLDLAQLQAGQLARVRLTAVILAPSRAISITETLPGSATLADGERGDFARADAAGGSLVLALDANAPGIYQYTYLVRLVAAGRYAAPASTISTPEGAGYAGKAFVLDVNEPSSR